MRGVHFSIIFTFIFFCPFTFLFAETSDEEIIKLGEEAIAYYEQRDYERAIQSFNTIILARPNDSQALKLRQLAGDELMLQMLAEGGELSRVARTLLLYAEKAPIRQEKNKDTIENLVQQAATGNLFTRNEATTLISTQVGERAIPYMLPYLASQTQETERINIILAITKMGRAAVVPLIETLNTEDSFLKQQVVILLGHLEDARSVADLKKVIEDPKEADEIKKYARDSIKKITKRPSISLPGAKELYYRKALNYYQEHPKYMPVHFANWLNWRWEQNQLVFEEIPHFAYNEIMAEHACYHAIDIDPTYKKAWGLLVQTYYAQHTEIEAIEEAAKDRGVELPAEELEQFIKEKKVSQEAKAVSAAAGYPLLVEALQMSFSNEKPEVTREILEAIGSQGSKQNSIHSSMIRALRHPDKRIRYAAAETIVKVNPPARFTDSDKAIKVLVEALSESDARVILVVDDNDESRNRLVNIIRAMNMVAFGATSGSEGLERAKAFPPEDLVIVSSSLEDVATSYFINAMREDYRTNKIPMLVTCDEGQEEKYKELYKEVDLVKGVLTRPFAEQKTQLTIREYLVDSNSDYKGKSREISRRAAEALAGIPISSRVFNVKLAQEALADSIRTRHDSIRGPAIEALSKFGDEKSVDALREVIYNNSMNIEIRSKAVNAMGQIFNRHNVKVPSEDVDKLMHILDEKLSSDENDLSFADKVTELHDSVFNLIGQSNISPADRRKIFVSYRIHKEIGVKIAEEKQDIDSALESTDDTASETREETDESSIWDEDNDNFDEFNDSSSEENTYEDDYGSEDDEYDSYDDDDDDRW